MTIVVVALTSRMRTDNCPLTVMWDDRASDPPANLSIRKKTSCCSLGSDDMAIAGNLFSNSGQSPSLARAATAHDIVSRCSIHQGDVARVLPVCANLRWT